MGMTDRQDIENRARRHLESLATRMAIVQRIVDHEDPQAVLSWAKRSLPRHFPNLFDFPNEAQNARAAYWLGRIMWNVMPLPSNGFRPKPLPEPQDEEPCPCDSGFPYAGCCRPPEDVEKPPLASLWPLLAECRPAPYWIKLEKAGKLPTVGFLAVARYLRDEGHWRQLQQLVEARLAPERRIEEPDLAEAIDWLCDAYLRLHNTPRKKEAMLARFVKHSNSALRAAANRRLAASLLDRGETERAWRTFAKAWEAEPHGEANSLLELTMLTATGRLDEASERAGAWLAHLRNKPDAAEVVLDTARRFQRDPKRALEDDVVSATPPVVRDLLDWLDEREKRRLPRLRLQPLKAEEESLRDAFQLAPSRKLLALEEDWHKVSQADKPFSTQSRLGNEEECWERAEQWIPWLRDHPDALDSPSILEDLALLLAAAEEDLGGPRNRWYLALVGRGVKVLKKTWPGTREGKLPWVVPTNRPLLRLLSLYIEAFNENWEGGRLEDAIRIYLQFNPNDNHGYRCHLVDRMLIEGRDDDALACASQYPTDMFAETRYGEVLALYRLGRLEDAEARLKSAVEHLPLVPKYLLRNHIARPKMDRNMRIGGKDQAWLYRHDMRDVWMATDGMRQWLGERVPTGSR